MILPLLRKEKSSLLLWLVCAVSSLGPICFMPLSAQNTWTQTLPGVGTFSSPRIADLNGDKVGDIIMGAGRQEFHSCDSAVIALDGRDGTLLWKVSAKDQVFGSAALHDLNGDGVLDPVIGGRSAELIAINGATGEVIWRFSAKELKNNKDKKGWFNFYNPQFIPDQDNDGIADILVSNGGDVMAEPYDPNRPVGHLVVFSGKNGALLARAEMPDGKEIYMSVTVSKIPGLDDYEVVFGTGGETIGGHLYCGQLSDIMKGDLSKAILLDSSEHRGYIGPAARVDITSDGITDIIVNTVNGRLLAFDGSDHQLIWEVVRPNTESYSSIAVGYFTEDTIPDFFVSYAQGVWPKLDWNTQFMVDGKKGTIEFVDSLGYNQILTPVVLDWNNDGRDEVLMSINFQEIDEIYQKFFYNTIAIVDFKTKEVLQLGEAYEGNNFSSTPWIGDLDGNGRLDIIYCHATNLRHTYTFDGFQVHRIATDLPLRKPIRWGAYQGSQYDGIFRKN